MSVDKRAALAAWRKEHYQNNKERIKEQCANTYRRRKASGAHAEYLQKSRDKRNAWNAAYRRRNGIVSREGLRLQAALRKGYPPHRSRVPKLVMHEQHTYWKANVEVAKLARAQWAKDYRMFKQLTDVNYRLYHRNKSKARKAKIRNGEHNKLSVKTLRAVFAKFGNACAYCGNTTQDLHIEHVIPIAKGGPHTQENVVPACPQCNFSKHTHEVSLWYRNQVFYCPDRWQKLVNHTGYGVH